MPSGQPKRCSAFTLIELLVVIAILALLIAILLPSLTAARELSRRTKCGANLHNLGIAFRQYGNDNDGRLPHLPHLDSAWGHNIGLRADEPLNMQTGDQNRGNSRNLFLLVKLNYAAAGQFICPSTSHTAMSDEDIADNWDFLRYDNLSYSYQNQWTFGTKVSDNAALPVLADRNPLLEWYWAGASWKARPADPVAIDLYTVAGEPYSANSSNHAGVGQNVLFVGGQVKWSGTPLCGLNIEGKTDNIYSRHDGSTYGETMTWSATTFQAGPYDRRDAWLMP